MTSNLNNEEAEQLLLDIRTGRTAASSDPGAGSGAFVVFPTSVVLAVDGRGHNVFPLRTTAEPGLLASGQGSCSVSGHVNGVEVEGRFWWVVERAGEAKVALPAATYCFRRGGREVPAPRFADQLPRSLRLQADPPASLLRQRARLVRKGRAAEHDLLQRSVKVFERCCRGPLARAIAVRPYLEVADVVQRAMHAVGRLLPLYASAARPPCSWLGMLQLDGRRDLHRAVTQLDWLPGDLAEVVARLDAAGVDRQEDPTVVLAAIIEAAVTQHRPVPRASLRQVSAALATPRLVSLDTSDAESSTTTRRALAADDPAFEGVEGQRGVAAAIGRLIGAGPGVVTRAWLDDDQAIGRIGRLVIASLRQPGETNADARQRCRQELATAGRIFASADGLARFGDRVSARDLAQLDATLAGIVRHQAS